MLARRHTPSVPPVPRTSPMPEGADEVMAILRSSAIVLDEESNVVKASPSAYAFGLVRQDRITVSQLLELTSKVRRDGQIRELELEVARSQDSTQTLHVLARVAPLGDRLVLALVEDRTHEIRVDEIRRDFVANVSHELKTPVGAMMLLAEAVEGASDDPEAVRRFAQGMQREGERLTRLVQEIIDLSRLQYDDPVQSPDPVEIDDVVSAAVDRSRVDAENRDIRLTTGGTKGLQVLGNEQQLVIAVGNLVENAVSYSPEGAKVSVGVRRRDDVVEISVTDQGYGIAEADLDRIFERFYRVDPARSRETGGTGLGLSIVKHIAASHGGDVKVWSVQGAGSTFTVRLPLHPYRPGQPSGVVSHAAREAP
ncbi:two-component sensor histidine kinase [Actinobacteria bacterium YIM 96077]|uniref:Sensor-like histidine kinase SenX3 n=2 Tax=Phytoactinopolyspora halophila TaxID=1981511 RepID=A0A329R548_9ACTN|nr:two-component sensor histidine kinase [Actinobacteria bacterium YIM 96077]RAW18188.1 two-component sensor histidine kinase [Phytoactinopolyspora halophila]